MRRKKYEAPKPDPKMRCHGNGISVEEYAKIRKGGRLLISLPVNEKELAIAAEYIFGVPLHLKRLDGNGEFWSYEVKEDHDDYHDRGFTNTVHGSDYCVDEVFWRTMIGDLYCGGIARASYGQVKVLGHRHQLRLAALRRTIGTEAGCSVRRAFERLAAHCRERREHSYSR